MTNPKLQKLRELNEARTKGPWPFEPGNGVWITKKVCFAGSTPEDSEFIAALANNAEWLIKCAEALDKLLVTSTECSIHGVNDAYKKGLGSKCCVGFLLAQQQARSALAAKET